MVAAKFSHRVAARREVLITPFGNAARVQLATVWMNEEWYNDRIRSISEPNWVCAPFQTLLCSRNRY